MTKVYYFSPECGAELLENARTMSEQACENEYMTNPYFEVYKYSRIKDFEESFNDGFVSYEGVIRFF